MFIVPPTHRIGRTAQSDYPGRFLFYIVAFQKKLKGRHESLKETLSAQRDFKADLN
jgi:hypothetical protein